MAHIEIIGLGAGDINQLSLGIYKQITHHSSPVYVRTKDHPVIQILEQEGVQFKAFDDVYEAHDGFQEVYETIADELLTRAMDGTVIYAVPGHPMLAEKTVQLLLAQDEVSVHIAGGQSYLDAVFTALQIDPIDGFQFVDATSFNRSQLDYRHHLVFCQVYDQFIASELKLSLLEDLPADFQVTVMDAVGSEQEQLRSLPLKELDYGQATSNLTSVYVPPVPEEALDHTFSRLREVIAQLRAPDGCPWDRKQTHESLRSYAIEEVYELLDAIDQQDDEGIVEELGDVLLQVMLHSQIGEDNGYFSVDDVIKRITQKMIHRHPHVFGDQTANTVADVYRHWDSLKQEEKGKERLSRLDGVAKGLPGLAKAFELQKQAGKVGFEWEHVHGVWDKLREEIAEVQEALTQGTSDEVEKELGDVLFVLANLSRYYNINPEVALNQTNQKFISRFSFIEQRLNEQGRSLDEASREEMDQYWDEAKQKE